MGNVGYGFGKVGIAVFHAAWVENTLFEQFIIGLIRNILQNVAKQMYEGEDLLEYCSFHFYKNYSFSAGGISSTLDDLVKFFENLYEKDTLVTRESFAQMVTMKDYYGYGFEKIIKETSEGKVDCYGHAGDNISFVLRNYYNPKTKDLVIVFANHYGDPYSRKIATAILKQL